MALMLLRDSIRRPPTGGQAATWTIDLAVRMHVIYLPPAKAHFLSRYSAVGLLSHFPPRMA